MEKGDSTVEGGKVSEVPSVLLTKASFWVGKRGERYQNCVCQGD